MFTAVTDVDLDARLELALTTARARLAGQMLRLNLYPEDGWKISTERRKLGDDIEFLLRPAHPNLEPPPFMELVRSGA